MITMRNVKKKNLIVPPVAKACTDWMSPVRVMAVPKIVRMNVSRTRTMFQTLSRPRRSWIVTECR